MKNPEQIAEQIMGDSETVTMWSDQEGGWVTIASQIVAAIEADRAQWHHRDAEIYIVQDDLGDVINVFRDAKEAAAAYEAPPYRSIIEETVWEPGKYAEQRIRTLTEQWEEAVNDGRDESEEPHRASDYVLSEDDWRAGLDDEEAAEIARLIEWQGSQK